MAFTDYKNLTILKAKHPQIIVKSERFIPELERIAHLENNDYVRENISLSLQTYQSNEFYIEENLVSPILRYVWQNMYFTDINMWTHQEIEYDTDLSGTPDYMFTFLDQKQYQILSYPILMIIESVEYDFVEGWAQCIAQMLACQKLNNNPNVIIFGIVTTGKVWEFAKLEDNICIKNTSACGIEDLPKLITILNYLLGEAKKQL